MMEQAAQQQPVFTAQIANYLGHGNVRTDYPNGGWSWNVIDLKLGRYKARLTQQREVIANKIKPVGLVYTTDLEISGIKKYVEGETVTYDLCRLLALASFSQVAPLEYRFEGSGRNQLNLNNVAMYYRPLIDIKCGNTTQAFIEKTWIPFRKLKKSRKLAVIIEMLTIIELPSQLLEVKLVLMFIIMENLKGTYAKVNNIPFERGYFRNVIEPNRALRRQPTLGFEALLNLMFRDVGMKPSLKRIIGLRNEIIHFGLSRKPYKSLCKDYDYCHDIVREYLLRLLGYDGKYLLYSQAASTVRELR